METASWSVHRLGEILSALSTCSNEEEAIRTSLECGAEALDCEVAALVRGSEIISCIGLGKRDLDSLAHTRPQRRLSVTIPGLGVCGVLRAPLTRSGIDVLVVAQRYPSDFSVEDANLLYGLARALDLAMRMLRTTEQLQGHRDRLEEMVAARTVTLEQVVDQLSTSQRHLRAAEADRDRLLSRTVDAAEQERTRVALDLHDGPIQQLTATAFVIDRLMRRTATEAPECAQLASRARRELSHEIDSLRQIMHQLRPPVLDQAGLEGALRDWAVSFHRISGITCEVVVLTETRLGGSVATALYRIAQEALANVQKHSGAVTSQVILSETATTYHMDVVDTGHGFDVGRMDQFVRTDHFGVAGMQQRAAMIGATCTLTSRPDGGTAVTVIVPLPQRTLPHRETSLSSRPSVQHQPRPRESVGEIA